MRILVLDGNENQAVAATRSLAARGHRVSVGASTSWSKAAWSRSCAKAFRYPAPQMDAEKFVQVIAEQVSAHGGAGDVLVLPMTERTTLPLSVHRAEILKAGGRLVLPSHETVLRAFDKEQTTRLAQELGIRTPRTFTLIDAADWEKFAAAVEFPIVLKPRASEEVRADGSIAATGAPVYARDAAELKIAYEDLRRRCSAVIAQEFIEGSGAGYFALMRHGELRAEFAHRRIRDVRPTGSGSAVRESVLPDRRVRDAALKILTALKWHGVAMVEFRITNDGAPVFLEVNGRFWNSLPLAVYAGVDFPGLLAEMAEHGDVRDAKIGEYEVGVRCRWLLGDARHTIAVMRGAPGEYAGNFPRRWQTLRDVLTPVRGTFHDNFQLRDPLPELGDWLDFARRVPQALRRRHAAKTKEEIHVQGRYSHS